MPATKLCGGVMVSRGRRGRRGRFPSSATHRVTNTPLALGGHGVSPAMPPPAGWCPTRRHDTTRTTLSCLGWPARPLPSPPDPLASNQVRQERCHNRKCCCFGCPQGMYHKARVTEVPASHVTSSNITFNNVEGNGATGRRLQSPPPQFPKPSAITFTNHSRPRHQSKSPYSRIEAYIPLPITLSKEHLYQGRGGGGKNGQRTKKIMVYEGRGRGTKRRAHGTHANGATRARLRPSHDTQASHCCGTRVPNTNFPPLTV